MRKEPGIILNSVFLALGVILPVARAQNPVPFIDSLSPPSVAPGTGQPLSLTIRGAGFAAGATVNFGGAPLTPSSITNAQITLTIPAASLAGARTANVTVANPNASPLTALSNVAFFSITNPSAGVFGTEGGGGSVDVYFGNTPVLGDFNGDGNLDVAISSTCNRSSCIVLSLGNGSGNLTAGSTFIVPAGVSSPLVAGDFNGDHNLDLASLGGCTDGASVCLIVLLGDGSGNFSIVSSDLSSSGQTYGPSLSAADFNGDGKLDLAVFIGGSPGTLTVMFGDGSGHFNPGPSISLSGSNPFPVYMATGDFNGDGKLDLAISAGGIAVLLGDGAGDFAIASSINAGGQVVAADFNGDGKLDLIVPGSILFGDGTGAFTFGGAIGSSGPVCVGDFNGDGKLDLAVSTEVSAGEGFAYVLEVQLGDGAGNLGPVLPFRPVGGGLPLWVTAGDFNGDGRTDVIGLGFNPDIDVYYGGVNGGFSIFLQSAAVDVTNSISVTSTGLIRTPVYEYGGFEFHGTVTLTNTGSQTVGGPLQLLFADLPPGVSVSPYGAAYVIGPSILTIDTGPGGIAPGQSISAEVTFFEQSNNRITYTPYVYSGTL